MPHTFPSFPRSLVVRADCIPSLTGDHCINISDSSQKTVDTVQKFRDGSNAVKAFRDGSSVISDNDDDNNDDDDDDDSRYSAETP